MPRLPAILLGLLAAGCAAPAWPGPSRPYQGVVRAIPGTVEAEDFDEGGEGVAYHDLEPLNQEKKQPPYRESGVDLEWREDAAGKFNLGWTRPGEWLVYTVDVREAGTYTIEMMVACNKRGGTFHLEFDGVDRTGPVEVPDTGGWKILKPFSKAGVTLPAGRFAMKLVLDKGGESGSIGDIDYFRFVKP
ncbi:MAG TPA: carbohydrate-binding protein [Planctomycetota bacterium]|nr:carbohydrate-binding protein [Planctomycetota bacterium]